MLKNPKSQRGRYWKLPVVAAITLFVTAVNAQQVIRIGFIDPVRLIEQAPQGGRALKQLEIEFQPSNENLMKQHNRIQEMEAELDKNILVISASDAQVRQREIDNLKRRLKRSQQEAREDYNLRRNEEIGKLQALVREIVVELAKEQGYDLIIEQAVYVSEAVNLTDEVLGRLAQLP
jgi:outer membrane protein